MKNKRLIIEIVCGIVILGVGYLVGYLVGDQMAIDRVNSAIDTKVSSTSNTSTQPKTTQTKEKNKNEAKVYKFGEEGQSGNWKIKILDSQETNTIQSGDGSDNKTTQQKFIVLKVQMTNVSQAATQYNDNEFALVNSKTKTQYQIDSDASLTASQAETIYKQNSNFFLAIDSVNPNMPKQTYIVFEVPKDFNMADGILGHIDSSNKVVGYNIK